MLVDLEPLSRATVQRVSVAVSQLELDVFVMGFHGPWADSEFLRDPPCSEPGAAQCKDMQLAVGQAGGVVMCCPVLNDRANSAQCDPRTNIKLTCENSINRPDQLLPRPSLHPVA